MTGTTLQQHAWLVTLQIAAAVSERTYCGPLELQPARGTGSEEGPEKPRRRCCRRKCCNSRHRACGGETGELECVAIPVYRDVQLKEAPGIAGARRREPTSFIYDAPAARLRRASRHSRFHWGHWGPSADSLSCV